MPISPSPITDAVSVALSRASDLVSDGPAVVGYGVAVVTGPDGAVKVCVPFANRITTAGDEYYARKAIVGIAPAGATAPTAVTGMKLGTDSATAAAKSGAGAALVAYVAGSNVAFAASYPQVAAVGGDGGWNATYQAVWAAGVGTSTDIEEVVIVTDSATNATSTAANTISRAILTTVNKGASDTLTVTWTHKFNGA